MVCERDTYMHIDNSYVHAPHHLYCSRERSIYGMMQGEVGERRNSCTFAISIHHIRIQWNLTHMYVYLLFYRVRAHVQTKS